MVVGTGDGGRYGNRNVTETVRFGRLKELIWKFINWNRTASIIWPHKCFQRDIRSMIVRIKSLPSTQPSIFNWAPAPHTSVPTPFFPSSLLLAPSALISLTKSPTSTRPVFSVTSVLNHLFSVSNCPILVSNAVALSTNSLFVLSRACSRAFFLMRKRADAAVLRRRLSSSAAAREVSLRGVVVVGEMGNAVSRARFGA